MASPEQGAKQSDGCGLYLGVRISLYCSFSTLVVAATDMGITMLLMSKELSPRRLLMGCCLTEEHEERGHVLHLKPIKHDSILS